MKVRILAFAQAKDVLGFEDKVVTTDQETVGELLHEICPAMDQFRSKWRFALNLEYVAWDTPLEEGEVGVIPPVSGG